MKIYKIVIVIFIVVFLSICFSCEQKKRFEVKQETVKQEEKLVRIERLDSAVIMLDRNNLTAGLKKISKKYPEIYKNYFDNLLEIDVKDTTFTAEMMEDLLTDSIYSKVNADVLKTFANIKPLEAKMATVYAYFRQYFPEIQLPELYFFVSGCNRNIFTHKGYIGIGADWYLGAEYPLYQQLTYEYMVQNMTPESIPIDVTSVILSDAFPFKNMQNRLIDNMLYNGRLLYIISVFLPNETEENITGYTAKQLAWCKKFERDIWAVIIDKKDLFSTDSQIIRAYIGDAPFTQPISQDSPGRLGTWLGYRIVKSYMNNNKNIDLQQLATENNFQQILEKSKYKP
jgi:hypothetical protein